jgi:hypothetical protein
MNSCFERDFRDHLTTIGAFDCNVVRICGCDGVLPLSIKVLLTDDKRWR